MGKAIRREAIWPKASLALALIVLGMAPDRPASAQYTQYANARSYLAAGEAVRNGYVAGLMDSFHANGLMPPELAACTAPLRIGQIRAIFDGWLEERPAQWSFSLPTLLIDALHQGCR